MRISVYLVVLFLCSLGLSVSAQSSYRLGAEDVVSITVLKHPEFSGDFYISTSGTIDLPGAGKIAVSGKTIDEITSDITARLSERLRTPEVTVALRTPRMQRIYVLGAVKLPGVLDFKTGWRVIEALAAAGGLLVPPEDCTATLLHAATCQQQRIAMTDALASKPEANILLAPGDVLTIDRVELLPIYVMGAVRAPGMQELRAGSGIIEALGKAGGLTLPENEVRISLQRNGKVVTVFTSKESAVVPVQRGDVLLVEPLRTTRVMVTGSVKSPGLYDLKDGEGIVEALTLAGGPLENASLSRIQITHSSGVSETVDIAQAFRDGGKSQQVKLAAGDLVIVPESTSGVVILGYVNAPGFYALRDGKQLTLSEAISLAKGTEKLRGGAENIAILRTTADGKQTRMIADLGKFIKTGDTQHNPEIRPGDIIYVPETRKPNWNLIFQTITSAAMVFNVVRN